MKWADSILHQGDIVGPAIKYTPNYIYPKYWDTLTPYQTCSKIWTSPWYQISTLVLLNLDMPCLCKQCRFRSVGSWRSQLIWICTICHLVFEFISTTWIKQSDWLKIRNGHGILIYSAGQRLICWKTAGWVTNSVDPDRMLQSVGRSLLKTDSEP